MVKSSPISAHSIGFFTLWKGVGFTVSRSPPRASLAPKQPNSESRHGAPPETLRSGTVHEARILALGTLTKGFVTGNN